MQWIFWTRLTSKTSFPICYCTFILYQIPVSLVDKLIIANCWMHHICKLICSEFWIWFGLLRKWNVEHGIFSILCIETFGILIFFVVSLLHIVIPFLVSGLSFSAYCCFLLIVCVSSLSFQDQNRFFQEKSISVSFLLVYILWVFFLLTYSDFLKFLLFLGSFS